MGIFSKYTTADAEEVARQHASWLALADGEHIEYAARTARDLLIFTDRRVVITDTQGFFSSKTEYLSIPYGSISRWSAEGRGKGAIFDGADLKLWVSSQVEPIVNAELAKDESAQGVLELLAQHVMPSRDRPRTDEATLLLRMIQEDIARLTEAPARPGAGLR